VLRRAISLPGRVLRPGVKALFARKTFCLCNASRLSQMPLAVHHEHREAVFETVRHEAEQGRSNDRSLGVDPARKVLYVIK